MTKLWIGVGVLIVMGTLFACLFGLRLKVFPEPSPNEQPAETKKSIFRAVVRYTFPNSDIAKYQYQGLMDCLAFSYLPGVSVGEEGSCLGLGTCAKLCPEQAIQMRDGLPVLNEKKCSGCGMYVDVCPQSVIRLVEVEVEDESEPQKALWKEKSAKQLKPSKEKQKKEEAPKKKKTSNPPQGDNLPEKKQGKKKDKQKKSEKREKPAPAKKEETSIEKLPDTEQPKTSEEAFRALEQVVASVEGNATQEIGGGGI